MATPKRRAYEAQFKLRVIEHAAENSNRAAGRHFNISESMVRKWRKQESLLRQVRKTKRSFRGQKARWPELEDRLAQWVVEQRAAGGSVPTVNIQRKAKAIAEEMDIEHFGGGQTWCFRFMRRRGLSVPARTTVAQRLWLMRELDVREPAGFLDTSSPLLACDSARANPADGVSRHVDQVNSKVAVVPGGVERDRQPLDIDAVLRAAWTRCMTDGERAFTETGRQQRQVLSGGGGGGLPTVLQHPQDAASQHVPDCEPLPETSLGQCKVEETDLESMATSGAPSPAEPQSPSSNRVFDAPVVSRAVSTPDNAGHPQMTVAAQDFVTEWINPECSHQNLMFGPGGAKSQSKRLKDDIVKRPLVMADEMAASNETCYKRLKPNANMPEKLRRRKLALAKKGKHLMMLDRKLDTIIKTLQKVPQTDVEELYRKLAEQELVIAAMQNDIDAKNYQIKLLQEELETLRSVNIPSHESPPKTDGPCHFYDCTGFTYDQFNSLCVFFDASTAKPPEIVFPSRIAFDCSSIPQRNQILLTLVKLRLNVDNEKFASQFQIGLPTVNGVLTTWVDYMYDQLSQLSTWPHRDTIFQNMPEGFKQHFPNTFAILSLIELQTELKPEKPDSLQPVTLTSGTTLKSLIACDPRGVVMYVSDLFPGSWSGREIFKKCNIEKLLRGCIQCGYLNAGDGLMVDKSLPIKDDVESIGLRMNIPPLDRMEPYDEETKMSEIFAEQLIHPQRAAAEIKRFQILSDATSMSQFGNANQVWHVVSMLANFVSHNFIK